MTREVDNARQYVTGVLIAVDEEMMIYAYYAHTPVICHKFISGE